MRYWAPVNSISIWWKGFPTPIARTMITYWQPTLCLFRSLALFKRAVITIIPPPFDYPTVSKGLLSADHEGKALNHHLPLIQCLRYNVKCIPLLPPLFMFRTLVFTAKHATAADQLCKLQLLKWQAFKE